MYRNNSTLNINSKKHSVKRNIFLYSYCGLRTYIGISIGMRYLPSSIAYFVEPYMIDIGPLSRYV